MTGKPFSAASEQALRAARRMMVEELEGIGSDPRAVTHENLMAMVLSVVGSLIQHGGQLSVTGGLAQALARNDGTPLVKLDLHGIPIEGVNFEDAIRRWLDAARADPGERMN